MTRHIAFCHSSYSCDPRVFRSPSDLQIHPLTSLNPSRYRYSNARSAPFTEAAVLWLLPAPSVRPGRLLAGRKLSWGGGLTSVVSTDHRWPPCPLPPGPMVLPPFSPHPPVSPEGPVSPSAENLLRVLPCCCPRHVSPSARSRPFVGGPVRAHRQGPHRPSAAQLLQPCPASSIRPWPVRAHAYS